MGEAARTCIVPNTFPMEVRMEAMEAEAVTCTCVATTTTGHCSIFVMSVTSLPDTEGMEERAAAQERMVTTATSMSLAEQ